MSEKAENDYRKIASDYFQKELLPGEVGLCMNPVKNGRRKMTMIAIKIGI